MFFKHVSSKTYGHDVGLSTAFRQWRATSHCNKLHGYALAFHFEFGTNQLDDKGWVVDFGSLSALKLALQHSFDHKTAISKDDPFLPNFQVLENRGALDIIVMPGVGCENFAEYAFNVAKAVIHSAYGNRVTVLSCKCSEHSGNSATYYNEDLVEAASRSALYARNSQNIASAKPESEKQETSDMSLLVRSMVDAQTDN